MVSLLQACQSTVIVLVVPTGASSVVKKPVGLPPLTLSTLQSSVVWEPMPPTPC